MNVFKNASISKKLVLTMSVVVSVILILVTIVIANNAANKRENEVLNEVQISLHSNSNQITQFLSEKIRVLTTIFRQPTTLNWIKSRTENGNIDPNKLQTFIDILSVESSNDPAIKSVFFGSALSGEYFYEEGIYNTDGYNVYGRDWWEHIRKTKITNVSDVEFHPTFKTFYSAINMPVIENGVFLGVAGGDILLDTIASIVSEMTYQNSGNAFLVNDKGEIIHFQGIDDYKAGRTLADLDQRENTDGFTKLLTSMATKELSNKVTWENTPHQVFLTPVSANDFELNWQLGLIVPEEIIYSPVNDLIWQAILLSLTLILVIAISIGTIATWLCRPLGYVHKALEEVSQGEGDLTQRLKIKSNDETASMADAVNRILSQLQEMMGFIAGASGDLGSAVNQVSTLTKANDQSNQDIQENMNLVVQAISELSDSAQHVDEQAQQASFAVQHANDELEKGGVLLNENQQDLVNLIQEFSQAVEEVKQLQTQSNEISAVLEVIEGVAAQTNLLALNAAIEAARAGEHGRGFSVVADEVRQLAARSQDSTGQIQEIIERLQVRSNTATKTMERAQEHISTFQEHSDTLAASLTQVNTEMDNCVANNSFIAEQAKIQSSTTMELDNILQKLHKEIENQLSRSEALVDQQEQLTVSNRRLDELVGNFKIQ